MINGSPQLQPVDVSGHVIESKTGDSTGELTRISKAYSRRPANSRYSLFDPANLLVWHEREERILSALVRHRFAPLERVRILEIGCGTGFWLREFVRWGARPENISGIELLPERVTEAKALCPSKITFKCQSATKLEFSTEAFDLVFQSTVFSSILDERMKIEMAHEMLRVLSPSGVIIWYDFTVNNPRNRDVRGIRRDEITQLFPGCRFEFQKLTLAPPIGRIVARVSRSLYRALSAVRLFDTHCLAIIQKNVNQNRN